MLLRIAMKLLLIIGVTLFGATMGVNHSIGWTASGTVDYTHWTSTNNFHVGDRLEFKYNEQFHDVMEVSEQDFESCNWRSPIVSYTTGDDSVELTAPGHHYFVCSIPGHCHAGQKLHIFAHCDPDPTPTPTSSSSLHIISFIQLLLLSLFAIAIQLMPFAKRVGNIQKE